MCALVERYKYCLIIHVNDDDEKLKKSDNYVYTCTIL